MYKPTARERVKLRIRTGLFLVLAIHSEAGSADLVCVDSANPYVLEDVPFGDILPLPHNEIETH